MRCKTVPASDEIPTSSMADIAFLLIIYFMVTTTFTATRGLDFGVPPDEAGPIDPIESVLVEVHAAGPLSVDRHELPLGDLLAYLAPKLRANPSKPVILRPDAETPYGRMVDVLDELRQGRERLALADDIVISIPTSREVDAFWH